VNVFTRPEAIDEQRILRQVGQHPQLDLRVVGGNNPLDLGVFGCERR
jgi:hypothetical protein